jgi:hypothetical protein
MTHIAHILVPLRSQKAQDGEPILTFITLNNTLKHPFQLVVELFALRGRARLFSESPLSVRL